MHDQRRRPTSAAAHALAATAAALSCAGAIASPSLGAAASVACPSKRLAEIRSQNALPPEIARILSNAHGRIAEPGEAFNVDDVADPRLPMSRFVLAGLEAKCALVALEHGGIVFIVELWRFERASGGPWQGRKVCNLRPTPTSLRDLTSSAAAFGKRSPPDGRAGDCDRRP